MIESKGTITLIIETEGFESLCNRYQFVADLLSTLTDDGYNVLSVVEDEKPKFDPHATHIRGATTVEYGDRQ